MLLVYKKMVRELSLEIMIKFGVFSGFGWFFVVFVVFYF